MHDDLIAVVGLAARLRGSLAEVLDTDQRAGPRVLRLKLSRAGPRPRYDRGAETGVGCSALFGDLSFAQ